MFEALEKHLPWEIFSTVTISRTQDLVFSFVSDISNVSIWSEECVGASWVKDFGLDQDFFGYNSDGHANWVTRCRVSELDAPTRFEYSVIDFEAGHDAFFAGDKYVIAEGDLVWGFEVYSNGHFGSSRLVHYMRLKHISPFFAEMLKLADDPVFAFLERKNQLQESMNVSVCRIKEELESRF